VYVEGSLRTRKYTDKNGVEKYATDIRADSMQMLGSRQGMGGPSEDGGGGGGGYAPRQAPARPAAAPAQRPAAAPKPAASNFDDMDDDIPF
jgi:single-strand DNA-binding protein